MNVWMLAEVALAPPGPGLGAFTAVVLTLVALGGVAWMLRRGALGLPVLRKGTSAMKVETAFPLGERRSLAIVSVEGRRLLLGLTPVNISLVAELPREAQTFGAAVDRHVNPGEPT